MSDAAVARVLETLLAVPEEALDGISASLLATDSQVKPAELLAVRDIVQRLGKLMLSAEYHPERWALIEQLRAELLAAWPDEQLPAPSEPPPAPPLPPAPEPQPEPEPEPEPPPQPDPQPEPEPQPTPAPRRPPASASVPPPTPPPRRTASVPPPAAAAHPSVPPPPMSAKPHSSPWSRSSPPPAPGPAPFDDDEETVTVNVNELLAEQPLPFRDSPSAPPPPLAPSEPHDMLGSTGKWRPPAMPASDPLPFVTEQAPRSDVEDQDDHDKAPDSGTQLYEISELERRRKATPFDDEPE